MTFSPISTFINTYPSSFLWRAPRAIVMVNGTQLLFEEANVITSTYYVSDTYQTTLPLNGQPSDFDLNYWASADNFSIKIYIGFPSNPFSFSTSDLDLFMIGDADDVQVDPLGGRVFIQGRDLTSRFIDTKTTQKFSNNTASQVATIFANNHGLTTKRIINTSTLVGVFYQSQQTLLTNEATEWDLLTFLAQQEDFVVFVEGNDLVFEPRPTTSKTPYLLKYQPPLKLQAASLNFGNVGAKFNGQHLTLSRSTTLTSDAKVTIRVPYSLKTGEEFNVVATSTHRNRGYLKNLPQPSGKKQKYSYVIPGLTREQATKKAQQILRDITQHEMRLIATVPGENTLRKDGVIQLSGTNTTYDQIYYADEVERRISADSSTGYTMRISAKNHSVDSQVII